MTSIDQPPELILMYLNGAGDKHYFHKIKIML